MTDKPWRTNAAEATTDIAATLANARYELRTANVRLAATLAVAQRQGDLLDTANAIALPYVVSKRLADWADLRLMNPRHTDTTPSNPARDRADGQASAQLRPYVEMPHPPGELPATRIEHYAAAKGHDLTHLVDTLGPLGPDPSLSLLQAYAELLHVPLLALVSGAVDDTPLPV